MLVPRMNRDVLTESRPTAREATEPEEDEVEASIEEGEAGDQIIRIELDTSPSQSGVCTDDEVDLSAECPDSNPLNLNPLNNKETDECETATEASEQEESPSRKRKEVMEHNDVSKKRKSDEFCLEPPALQIPPNITITECSTADKTDKIINAREEPTEDSRPIVIVQEIKAIEQSPEIVSSEISKSQKIVEETPIAQLVQPSTISKNDQETETLVDVLICQDTMDSGIHETEENSSRLQQTQIICEKKECNPSEGVEQSPQSVSCNGNTHWKLIPFKFLKIHFCLVQIPALVSAFSMARIALFSMNRQALPWNLAKVQVIYLNDIFISPFLVGLFLVDLSPSPCISEQVSISRPDSETTLIYAKVKFLNLNINQMQIFLISLLIFRPCFPRKNNLTGRMKKHFLKRYLFIGPE